MLISINGSLIGNVNGPGIAACSCAACESYIAQSGCWFYGLPGWVSGGANNLCLDPNGNWYISYAEVQVCCAVPLSPTPSITCPPTLSRTCTPWRTNTITRTWTISPTRTGSPTITLTMSPTPIVCNTCAINCVTNGGFENGSISGWTFSASCALGNGPSVDPWAGVVTQGPADGCSSPSAGCSVWTHCSNCINAFNAVACGQYAAMAFSGEPPTCPAPSWGQLQQTFTVPAGGAILSFYWAYSPDTICGATGDFEVRLAGGGCGTAVIWSFTASACTPWTFQQVNLCAYGNCPVTIRMRSNAPGAPCGFTYMDQVCCQPCSIGSPTPTATKTDTRTVTRTSTVTSTATATNTVSQTSTVTSTATVTR